MCDGGFGDVSWGKQGRFPVERFIGSDGAISLDCFGSLPVMSNGSKHVLLVTDRFSRREAMHPVSAEVFLPSEPPRFS